MDEKDKLIRDAQFRKSLSISYFNSLNAAIEVVKSMKLLPKQKKAAIEYWRDWFIEEHKSYYAANIAKVGTPYDAAKTIEWVMATKSLEELKALFIAMSEDERRDETIITAVKLQKVALAPKKINEKK